MSVSEIQIIKVEICDVIQLQQIAKTTFFETFSEMNSEDDMKTYLEKNFSIENLENQLNDNNTEYYFASFNNEIVGYLKLNTSSSQTEYQNDKTLEIERIYSLKTFHGKNIGQMLFNKAFEIAKSKRVDAIWLGVWEKNQRAIAFYKKNNFVEFDTHIFKLGSDNQVDIIMRREI